MLTVSTLWDKIQTDSYRCQYLSHFILCRATPKVLVPKPQLLIKRGACHAR